MSEHRHLARGARLFTAAALSTTLWVGCGSSVSNRGAGQENQRRIRILVGGGNGSIGGPLGGLSVDSDAGTAGGGANCATTSAGAMLVKQPVDIILVLDNSGSMADELAAAEQNINVNFAQILAAAAVDYRVILISRHRKDVRAMSGESSTSVCVEAPLSGLAKCPSAANPASVAAPVFSDRFFQYNVKIESHDSFETGILAGYHSPDARTHLTTVGWKEWLRPNAKKVFLEMSDDDEGVGDDTQILTVDQLITQLITMAPEFGRDAQHLNFVFHSIVGLAEKAPATSAYLPTEPVQREICTGNADDVTNPAPTYQELSRRTGGLRFPIRQFAGYDTVFHAIAEDVIMKSQLACDFAIPPPPEGETLDLGKVAVKYTKGDGSGAVEFGQALTQGDCQSNAFYIKDNRIFLCTDTCSTVEADSMASVDVLFTCASTIIVK